MNDIRELENISREIRIDILKMLHESGSGHTGGSLSAADVAVAIYFSRMNFDVNDPGMKERDRFILSKGHAAPLLYAILARAGYIAPDVLASLRKIDSPLQGHPCCELLPGVEVSTGSLGQGLSVANGIAMGLKLDNIPSRVFCIMGDGEVQEGQIWEAAMTAAHYKLDNICGVVDNNGLQIDGPVEEVMGVAPLPDKWEAFGWNVIEVNGHKMDEILGALDDAGNTKGRPTVIIAHTVKGKGVSIFEGKVEYHGVAPTADELEQAMKELNSE
ncbi:MAG TPA: transketolase [Nitrospirae bacterium]|nr:transketolase [Nitrospirota bacterium]HDK81643.1 transketolase [Nitrospirota bacterium]